MSPPSLNEVLDRRLAAPHFVQLPLSGIGGCLTAGPTTDRVSYGHLRIP